MILLKTFTAGFKLGWILRPSWFVNVPLIVLAIVIKGDTRVNWRIVMLKAFIRIFRNPKTRCPSIFIFLRHTYLYHEVDLEIEIMTRIWIAPRIIVIAILANVILQLSKLRFRDVELIFSKPLYRCMRPWSAVL